jgi:MoxR-like ATPase
MADPESKSENDQSNEPPLDLEPLKAAWAATTAEVEKRVVGHHELVEQLMITLLSGGHCLLAGMPGTARALTTSTLARILGLDFHRLRCTPDLSPEDITQEELPSGTATGERGASGLLFANILLVDDLVRLSPRTHSVLQQAIQDHEVTVAGSRRRLPNPFLVVATRYPEDDDAADMAHEPRDDRFMLEIQVRYPDYHGEYQIAASTTAVAEPPPRQILSAAEILLYKQQLRRIEAPAPVVHYTLRLVRSTRVHEGENPDFVYEWVQRGAGPRAAHYLLLAAKARAALYGRTSVSLKDVRSLAHAVLRHRILTNRNARTNGITTDRVIDRLVHDVPDRVDGDETPPAPGDSPDVQHWTTQDVLDLLN